MQQEVLLGLSMPHKKAFKTGGQEGGERAEGDSGNSRVLNLEIPPPLGEGAAMPLKQNPQKCNPT